MGKEGGGILGHIFSGGLEFPATDCLEINNIDNSSQRLWVTSKGSLPLGRTSFSDGPVLGGTEVGRR